MKQKKLLKPTSWLVFLTFTYGLISQMKYYLNILGILFFIFVSSASAYENNSSAKSMRPHQKHEITSEKSFNEKKFLNAYNVFLANGNVKEALAIAMKAMKMRPDDVDWKKRYVRAAMWSGQGHVAFTHLSRLALNRQADIDEAIKMGNDLNAYHDLVPLLEYKLKNKPHNPTTVVNLAQIYDKDGQPDKAIALLHREIKWQDNKDYWLLLAKIYKETGNQKEELNTLAILSQRYGSTSDIAKRKSQIFYNLGNLKLSKSELLQGHNDKNHDKQYWNKVGDLAWLLGDHKTAKKAYYQLHNQRQIDQESLRRLIILLEDTNPQESLHLAMSGWRYYHDLNFFILALPLAIQLNNWEALSKLYGELTPAQKESLNEQLSYWHGRAILSQRLHGPLVARQQFKQALQQHPGLTVLKPAYLEFLNNQLALFIDQQDEDGLINSLQLWAYLLPEIPELSDQYVRAYLMLDNPRMALAITLSYGQRMRRDYYWNLQYADILERLGYTKQAYDARVDAWNLISQQLLTSNKVCGIQLKRGYTELAAYFCGGNITYFALVNAAYQGRPDALLSWALQNDNNELARYLLAYYYPSGDPAWATLKIAIQQNDKATIKKMLATMDKVLPATDKVAAAKQLDDLPLAQKYAYESVEANPDDNVRYEQLADVIFEDAEHFSVAQEYEAFGNILGPRTRLDAKLFFTPYTSITPYASIWVTHSKDETAIVDPPSYDEVAGLVLENKNIRNRVFLNVGQRKNLYGFATALFGDNFRLTERTLLGIKLGINQRSPLNDLMLISGVQDEIVGTVAYQLTARDRISGRLEWDNYNTQNRINLGNGYVIAADVSHQLWFSYPNYAVRAFGSVNQFSESSNTLTGRVLDIIPSTEIPSANLFIPPDFWQIGLGFNFGEQIKLNYTKAWRPYASLNVFYTSSTGIGDFVDLGYAGSLIGNDKLMIYANQSTNLQGTTQLNYLVGAKYLIYF